MKEVSPLNKERMAFNAMDNTQSFVSMGQICVNLNYAFHWPPGRKNNALDVRLLRLRFLRESFATF